MREELSKTMDEIRAKGHTITQDWTKSEVDNIPERTAEDRIRYAREDICGVVEAELVLAVMDQDDYPYQGTRHEIGATMAMKEMARRFNAAVPDFMTEKQLWIVCNGGDPRDRPFEEVPNCMKCLFEYAADRYFQSVDEALSCL
jgi:hypothetical protein